jgi:hypothetical protein
MLLLSLADILVEEDGGAYCRPLRFAWHSTLVVSKTKQAVQDRTHARNARPRATDYISDVGKPNKTKPNQEPADASNEYDGRPTATTNPQRVEGACWSPVSWSHTRDPERNVIDSTVKSTFQIKSGLSPAVMLYTMVATTGRPISAVRRYRMVVSTRRQQWSAKQEAVFRREDRRFECMINPSTMIFLKQGRQLPIRRAASQWAVSPSSS